MVEKAESALHDRLEDNLGDHLVVDPAVVDTEVAGVLADVQVVLQDGRHVRLNNKNDKAAFN